MATENGGPRPQGDVLQLERLRSDRRTLAARLERPRWFAPGLGLVVAAVVAVPVVPDGPWRDAVLVAALAAGIALTSLYHRSTGIRTSRVGARAAVIYAWVVGVMLLLLSVSFGLAAEHLRGWIAATTVTAFVVVTWLVRAFVTATRERLSHGL